MAKLPLIVLGVYAVIFALSVWVACKRAKTVEPTTEKADPLEDMEPVSCQEILDSEMPYISYS